MKRADEMKQQKARNLRYRKPLVKDLNFDSIMETVLDIMEGCDEVRYFLEDADKGSLINALCGDEEDEWEFRMMFSDLCAECDRMYEDMHNAYVPDCFDVFFASIDDGEILGWDSYEGDYYGLEDSYEDRLAKKEAQKKMMRMTKKEILDAAADCFGIVRQYMGLVHRYDCLKAAMDIMREENTGYLMLVRQINEVYEAAERDCFRRYEETTQRYEALLKEMPREAWLW